MRIAALLLFLVSLARAQWPDDSSQNLPLATGGGEQVTPRVAATADGGAYVLWYDNAGGNYDVRLQRLDAAGVPQWEANGLLLSNHPMTSFVTEWDLAVDTADHALVATNDIRDGGDWDIHAYRVSPDGEAVWGNDGLPLDPNDGDDVGQQIEPLANGDILFAWQYVPPEATAGVIQLVLVDAAGTPVWDSPLQVSDTYSVSIPRMAATADGGFLLSVVVSQGSSFGSPRHLYLHRYTAEGEMLWSAPLNTTGGIGIQMRPEVLNDGAGGAICWWYDSHLANQLHAFVQRVSATGEVLWPAGGVQVGPAGEQQGTPTLCHDVLSDQLTVAWESANAGQTALGMAAQRLDAQGQPLWNGDAGVTLVALGGEQCSHLALHDLPGGSSMLCYQQADPGGGLAASVRALALDAQGAVTWTRALTTAPAARGHLHTARSPSGMLLAVFEDERNGNADLYLQNVHPDGSLGAPAEPGLELIAPAAGDTLAFRELAVHARVTGFALAAEGGDGLLRARLAGPVDTLTQTFSDSLFQLALSAPGAWHLELELVDYEGQALEPPVMQEAGGQWIQPLLEITSPEQGATIESPPYEVWFSLEGLTPAPQVGGLEVWVDGVYSGEHFDPGPVVLDPAPGPEEHTVRLVLLNGAGLPALPEVADSVGFFLGGTFVDEGETDPGGFRLGAPWPNPFNPATSIELRLPRAGAVSLSVYDLQGRRVRILHEGRLAAGSHVIHWRAEDLPSGCYLLRAKAEGGHSAARKALLLR